MKKILKIQWLFTIFLVLASNLSQASVLNYSAMLSGAAEAPPNNSLGSGTAWISIDTASLLMTISANFAGLTGATRAAHIHCCTLLPETGTAGVATEVPTFSNFPLGVTSGSFMELLDLNNALSYNPAFITSHGGTVASAYAAFILGLDSGSAYFNVHSTFRPAGEIRGFLSQVPEPAPFVLLLLGLSCIGYLRVTKK
jgi:hypothetical protein